MYASLLEFDYSLISDRICTFKYSYLLSGGGREYIEEGAGATTRNALSPRLFFPGQGGGYQDSPQFRNVFGPHLCRCNGELEGGSDVCRSGVKINV